MTTRQLKKINSKVDCAYNSQLVVFLTDQKNIGLVLSFLASLGLTTTIGDSSILFPILTGATGYATISSVLKALNDTRKFSCEYKKQLIRDTDEYKECLELYNSLTTDIAYFIKSLHLKDSLDIGMFYQELLYNGFLSKENNFNYHIYDMDEGICPEIYGARISSGTGVCRHIASLLKDIYEKLGYTASYLSVGGAKSTLLSNIKTRIMPSSINHAVVCVKDCYGKFIIDPTWEKVAVFDNDEKFAHIIGDTTRDTRYVIGYTTLINRVKLNTYDSYIGIRKAQIANLIEDDVISAKEVANELIVSKRSLILQFYYSIKKRLEQIADLEHELSCYQDIDKEHEKKLN